MQKRTLHTCKLISHMVSVRHMGLSKSSQFRASVAKEAGVRRTTTHTVRGEELNQDILGSYSS